MSQVSLKEVEIKELKEENEKIKSELARSIEERNKTLNDKSQLLLRREIPMAWGTTTDS